MENKTTSETPENEKLSTLPKEEVAGWEKEWEKRIESDNYQIGEYDLIEPNDSLLYHERYLESEFELDADKIKSFITKTIAQEREKLIKELILYFAETQGECIKDPFDNEHEYFSKASIITKLKSN